MNQDNKSDKILENERHDSSNSHVSNSIISDLSFSKKDKKLNFIHRKFEKIAQAVYIITGHFRDEEPLKWSIRKLCTDILVSVIRLGSHSDESGRGITVQSISSMQSELLSLLDVAGFSGLISPMNISILKRELQGLSHELGQMPRESFYSGVLLDNAFFEQKEISETIAPVQTQTVLPVLTKIQTVPENVKDKFVDLKSHHTVNTQETTDDKDSKLRDFSVVAVKKNKRQSIIISLLKRKKEVMIKDITETITDCSEKTIQRELAALVDEGILKKEGERRWTRYMLA